MFNSFLLLRSPYLPRVLSAFFLLAMVVPGAPLLAQLTYTAPSFTAEDLAKVALPELETRLRPLADTVLAGQQFEHVLAAHRQLKEVLLQVLQRPDSYNYSFDSLSSLSRIYPEDQSFRIFTWQLADPSGNHTYGGIVQRRLQLGKDNYSYAVIPLEDRVDMTADIETLRLPAAQWLGALYYKPRNSNYGVLTFSGSFRRFDGLTGKSRLEKVQYYVLLGYNAHTANTSYKIIDAITFEAREPTKAFFGAPIFYLSRIPRARAVFKYTDNSNFTLNYMPVLQGKRKVNMIVFDHLAVPYKVKPSVAGKWDYGADGSVDALKFYHTTYEQRTGFFGILKNVTVYDPTQNKYDPKEWRRRAEEQQRTMRSQGIEMNKKSTPRP